MLFSKLFLFTALATAAAVVDRALPNGKTTRRDIVKIHRAVLALNEQVTQFQGTPPPTSFVNGQPILEGVVKIHNVNRVGFAHATAALPFTKQDSVHVIDTTVRTVNVSIPASTENIKSKVAEFQEAGFVPVVIGSLSLLLNDHDTFSAAVFTKLTGLSKAKTAEGASAVASIHNAIQDAIVFYTEHLP